MAKIHVGATLIPHFRDFLPGWVARQEWYRGSGTPSLRPIGFFRFEDPAGQVGIETHLVSDGTDVYQIPMTYRGAPIGLADGAPGLIATAQHSVLGTRWIYDGTVDPVWRQELLRLVQTGGVSDPSAKRGVAPAEARGHPLGTITPATATIDLRRLLTQITTTNDAAGDTAAAGPAKDIIITTADDDTATDVTAAADTADAGAAGDAATAGSAGDTATAGAAGDAATAGGTGKAVTADVAGEVVGTWHPDGPESPATTGLLAVVRSPRLDTR